MELEAMAGGGVERLAYSPAEVAAACGLSRKAIYRAIETGELRAAKVCRGARLLILSDELRAWIERSATRPTPRVAYAPADPGSRSAARTPLRDVLRDIDAA
jgi:excisionase family DNA binding protein